MNIFDKLTELIRSLEYSIVNFASTIAPWLAPLAPAYLSYRHMQDYLDFPQIIAFSLALVVEILGLATVSTTMLFWNHNRRYKNHQNRIPLTFPILSFLFYLGTVLSLNVLLQVRQDTTAIVIANALLVLLSVPAAVTISVRAIYQDVQIRLKGNKGSNRKVSQNLPEVAERSSVFNDWRNVPHEDRMKIATMKTKTIVRTYGVAERTARNWKKNAIEYASEYVYGEK